MTKQSQISESDSELEQVDLVDQLMAYYRNNVNPPDALLLSAYKARIDVEWLREYVQEYECRGEI